MENFKKASDENRNYESQPIPVFWIVKLKIRFYGLIRISFKVVKIFENWCGKRTQRDKISLQTEFEPPEQKSGIRRTVRRFLILFIFLRVFQKRHRPIFLDVDSKRVRISV